MKQYLKTAVICIVILCTAAVFCACNKQEEESAVPVVSYTSGSDELNDELKDIAAQYFSAVPKQDHMNVARISTEDFEYNYNETAFLDYARTVEHFELGNVDMSRLVVEDDIYTVPVNCVLTINDYNTDENGNEQETGKHEFCYIFSFKKTGEGYKINSITESAFG